jgi:phage shock protein PspC (stress-responsive transcriptional regulator)
MENPMKKLYRSRRDKKLFGLCGGIAEMLNVDSTLLRILAVVIAVFTSGAAIPVYVLASLVVPKEPNYGGFGPTGFGPSGFGPGGYNGGWQNGGYGSYTNNGFGGGYANPQHGTSAGGPAGQPGWQHSQQSPNLDAMMEDLEKKALRREIEELKAKLAKYEKGEN